MAMISYAQNFEDVMLARTRNGVRLGFHADVGAQDPEEDPVSKSLDDPGRHGPNFDRSIDAGASAAWGGHFGEHPVAPAEVAPAEVAPAEVAPALCGSAEHAALLARHAGP